MNEQKVLKNMSNAVTKSYDKYLDASAHKNLNIAKIALPKQIKQKVFDIARRNGAVFYGSFVIASSLKNSRRTYDFDFYLKKANIYKFIADLEKVFGNKFTYRKNNYGMIKIYIMNGKDNLEIADIGTLENIKKDASGKYVLTSSPLLSKTSNKPFVNSHQTLEFEHQRNLRSNIYDLAESPKRLPKDAYNAGMLNRDLITRLFAEYRKKPTNELNQLINKFARLIVSYSTDKKIQALRRTFEVELVKSKMVTFYLYSPNQTRKLEQLKTNLRNPNYDITKDARYVAAITPQPIKTAKKSTPTKTKKIVRKPTKKDPVLFGGGGGIW